MNNGAIERMLQEADRVWLEGADGQANFLARLATAHALLNISKVLHEVVNEHNQLCVKAITLASEE